MYLWCFKGYEDKRCHVCSEKISFIHSWRKNEARERSTRMHRLMLFVFWCIWRSLRQISLRFCLCVWCCKINFRSKNVAWVGWMGENYQSIDIVIDILMQIFVRKAFYSCVPAKFASGTVSWNTETLSERGMLLRRPFFKALSENVVKNK